ncbi:MAG: alpha/beta hydrolase [Steroidobacteraceae bacterium]
MNQVASQPHPLYFLEFPMISTHRRAPALIAAIAAILSSTSALADSANGTEFKTSPDMLKVLTALSAMKPKPMATLTAADARLQPTPADAVNAVLKEEGKSTDPMKLVPGVTSEDKSITVSTGMLPIRVYTPAGKGPFPVIVYYHGGGWVIADKKVYDGGARGLSKEAKAVVVSVDYRRAPESKFPAQWDDSLAAYKWVTMNAASLNGNPAKLALAGESAGGNLAVATAVAARDAKLPPPVAVLSVYPIAQAADMSTESYRDSAMAKPLNKAMMAWFFDKTLSQPSEKTDPRVDLVHANLAGLPPVTIINAQIDPLRSDGEMLEAALKKAGVKVERKVYDGVTHEFFGMAAVVESAKDAQAFAGAQLRKQF